jgi:hypothetical protein
MAYAPTRELDNSKVLGRFVEKTHGMTFEYSENSELILSPLAHGGRAVMFPHKIWVGPLGEFRYGFVKFNSVHIIIDETDNGWVVEKWEIKQHRKYFK